VVRRLHVRPYRVTQNITGDTLHHPTRREQNGNPYRVTQDITGDTLDHPTRREEFGNPNG